MIEWNNCDKSDKPQKRSNSLSIELGSNGEKKSMYIEWIQRRDKRIFRSKRGNNNNNNDNNNDRVE